jgi:hypothetical protein
MATMSNADEPVTRFAQRHRLRAAAALVQIVNDEDASASARVAASQSILAYSDGKPGVTKHVTPADVAAMSIGERHSLWKALFEVETDFPDFVIERINDTVQREARRLTTAKANRFTRGQPEPRPPHVIPSRNAAIETPAVARERRAEAMGTSTTPMPATASEAAPVAASPAASPAESSTPAGMALSTATSSARPTSATAITTRSPVRHGTGSASAIPRRGWASP